MELVDALGLQAAALLGGERGGDQAARVGIVVEPGEMAAIQAGIEAPHAAPNFCTWAKLVTGRMPGTIGTVIPARAARSRKRRKSSTSKKNWVIARVAPASILRLQIVEVGCGARRFGMGLGIGRDADLEIGDASEPGDEIGGIGIAAGVRRGRPRPPAGGSPRSATMWRMPASQ